MACNNLANFLVREGRSDEAGSYYRQALQLRPDYVEAHYNLANLLLQEGEVQESIAHCETALALDPERAEAHNNLANALRQNGQFREAIAHYEKAVALKPENVFFWHNLAWTLATCPDGALRDGRRAVALAEEADRRAGGSEPLILFTLATAYEVTEQFDRALETARRGSELAARQGNRALLRRFLVQIERLEARER